MPISESFEIESIAARPREHLRGAEWAERYRVLTSLTSGLTGPWQNSVVKIAEGVLNAITSDNVAEVAWCSGTQNAKTETILNAIGYLIHQAPAPIMLVYPEKDDAKYMSKIRLADMIESARGGALSDRVSLSDKRQDIFNIPFVGGLLSLAWSTNVNKLASKPIKYLFLDEIDKYQTIKGHGNPLSLVRERQKAFPHSRLFMASSPTFEEGAIWQAIHEADYLFRYYVMCPHCEKKFIFTFEGLRKDEENIFYVCSHCSGTITNVGRRHIIDNGEWLTEEGEKLEDIINSGYRLRLGFHSSTFYSPFVSFAEIYKRYERAKANPQDLKVFINGWLGEPYDDSETGMEQATDTLMARVETWDKLPLGVCCLTCAVDVQKNRLEILVKGWGLGRESWVADKKIIHGDPLQEIVWRELETFICETRYPHSAGIDLNIQFTAIDSGYQAEEVYRFCHNKSRLNIYPIKGGNKSDLPAVGIPRKAGRYNTTLFTLGVHGLKTTIHYWLSLTEPGPGYIHFKEEFCDKVFFEQLTAEKLVTTVERGRRSETWVKIRERNEVFDLECYNLGAFLILNPPIEHYAAELDELYNSGGHG